MGYSGRAGRSHKAGMLFWEDTEFSDLIMDPMLGHIQSNMYIFDQTGFHSADHLAGTV